MLEIAAIVLAQASSVPCTTDRQATLDSLRENSGAQVVGRGLSGERMAELIVAPDGRWFIFLTTHAGITCAIGGGTHWESVEPDNIPEGEPG